MLKMLPLALVTLVITASADEAEMKKAMEAKIGTKIESVTKSGYLGFTRFTLMAIFSIRTKR